MLCRNEWRTRAADSIEAHKKRELAKIDVIELEAVKGWERSVGIHKVTTTKKTTVKGDDRALDAPPEIPADEITVKTQPSPGNPRFLDIILKCTEARRRILGLDAPANVRVDDLQQNIDAVLGARARRLDGQKP